MPADEPFEKGPERIWLQLDPNEDDQTWSAHRVNENDVEYRRVEALAANTTPGTPSAVSEKQILRYSVSGIMTCHHKIWADRSMKKEWCRKPADLYASWPMVWRGGTRTCTRPLCQQHAVQWAVNNGLTVPEAK